MSWANSLVREAFPLSAEEVSDRVWVYVDRSRKRIAVLDVTDVPPEYPVLTVNHRNSTMLAYANAVFLENAAFVVNLDERQYGINRARISIEQGDEPKSTFTRHAVVMGALVLQENIPADTRWREVVYSPAHHDTFVDKLTGAPVLSARYVMTRISETTGKPSILVPA